MKSTVFEPYHRFEGETIRQGLSYNGCKLFDYVFIRRENNILEITIPKDAPKEYDVAEIVLDSWDQKLWL